MDDFISDDAYQVPRYLQEQGYRIVPVNPKLDSVLGERAVSALAEIPDAVDIVDLFRAPPHVPAHVDEILALPKRPRAVWMQLGIAHEERARQLIAEGVEDSDTIGAMLMELVIKIHCIKSKVPLAVHTIVKDNFKYGVGIGIPGWPCGRERLRPLPRLDLWQ